MKTKINTQTAGIITINSEFLGDKSWGSDPQNYNNYKVTVSNGTKSFSFDFWGSIMNPEISNDQENVFALYCALTDGIRSKDGFENFCGEFGYNVDSRKAEKIFKTCEKTLEKLERVFDCDLYDLINEIQEKYDC